MIMKLIKKIEMANVNSHVCIQNTPLGIHTHLGKLNTTQSTMFNFKINACTKRILNILIISLHIVHIHLNIELCIKSCRFHNHFN